MRIPLSIAGVEIERAWPTADETFVVEGRDASGAVRAGRIVATADGFEADIPPSKHDPKLPQLADAPGELVGHRAGKRAVLRNGDEFWKVVRSKKADGLLRVNAFGAELASAAGFTTATPRLVAPGVLATDRLPGVGLKRAGESWQAAWDRWAQLWPGFIAQLPEGLVVHRPADEAQVLEHWIGTAVGRGLIDDGSGAARAAARRIGERLVAESPALALSHRDLHDGQMLYDPETGQLSILDLDTLSLAEPALDLGNLAVHAVWRAVQGTWSRAEADVVLQAVMTAAGHAGVSPHRVQLAQAATALRLAAVYSYRPRWRALARRWLDTWLTKPVLG
ncbi:phosphotransferase [Tessaracoccus sp. OH4464_COT-324]|uniref:phosphotransferase n=1 Tax=Tessaracoccus sp. OH4464_COT-324 TaxID=2491059 RepID=UPI000F637454|nr:phosphotransferase [Tessaracoccus sp. OH4464_COT-324]RRD46889.1 hypothetical protein EII42_05520 [Tessaracoccus sp. OH4464_COT-324]